MSEKLFEQLVKKRTWEGRNKQKTNFKPKTYLSKPYLR